MEIKLVANAKGAGDYQAPGEVTKGAPGTAEAAQPVPFIALTPVLVQKHRKMGKSLLCKKVTSMLTSHGRKKIVQSCIKHKTSLVAFQRARGEREEAPLGS